MVALKVLPPDKLADERRTRRFIQEARSASALNHPNVVTIHDIDSDNGVDFIAMEYVAGRSLEQVIPRKGMRVQEVLKCGVQMADALAAAHAAGIIHRDLKPSNVMVSEAGSVKVLDFGIAKLTEDGGSSTEMPTRSAAGVSTDEGQIVGTVAYMSPEQAQGLRVDARSDVFSFGAVLYEMVSGRRAFVGETKMSTLAAILDREPQSLNPTTPRELDRIIRRCLRKDPARRFQTMADLRVALEELREESDSGSIASPLVHRRRLPRALLVSAVIAIVVAGLGGVWWLRDDAPPPASASAGNLRQLTFDSGQSTFPSLSPDARFVAYQSNRASAGRFDIWMQQTAGGAPIRLTSGPSNNRAPAFAADGTKVFIESTGPPHGIYEVSTLGGEPRLLAPGGMFPAVSPDGQFLAYTTPSSELYLTAVGSGEPRQLAADFSLVAPHRPLWFPDSREIGIFAQRRGEPATREWWAVPIDGAPARQLNWVKWAGVNQYYGRPDAIGISTLSRRPGENEQIYFLRRLPRRGWLLDMDARVEPLTSGASWSSNASVAAGKMAFQSGTRDFGLWTLPADTNAGRVTGPVDRFMPDQAVFGSIQVSADGRTLVYSTNRTGSMDIVVRDLTTGQERLLTSESPERSKDFPVIDAKGTQVFYSMNTERDITAYDVYAVTAVGGRSRRVCEACGPTLSLSPDASHALVLRQDGAQNHIGAIDTQTGAATVLLRHPQFPINSARLSPDGERVAFVLARGVAAVDVMVAPFRKSAAIEEREWVQVTDEPANVRYVFWSPDSSVIYYEVFTSAASHLMARRLDRTGQPTGPAQRVHEFAGPAQPVSYIAGQPLVALPDRFIGVLAEFKFNIWMMDLPQTPPAY